MNINVEKLYLHFDFHENFALVSIVFFFSRGKIKYLISKEDEMVVFDDDYDASEEYESDDNEDSICQLAIQELYEMSPTKTKYLGRADAITRVIFGKKELRRKKTKFGFTLKDCVMLFKTRKYRVYRYFIAIRFASEVLNPCKTKILNVSTT